MQDDNLLRGMIKRAIEELKDIGEKEENMRMLYLQNRADELKKKNRDHDESDHNNFTKTKSMNKSKG